jgi:hypothetical protein
MRILIVALLLSGCVGGAYKVIDADNVTGTFRIVEPSGATWACIVRSGTHFECVSDTSPKPGTPPSTLTGAVKHGSSNPIVIIYPDGTKHLKD